MNPTSSNRKLLTIGDFMLIAIVSLCAVTSILAPFKKNIPPGNMQLVITVDGTEYQRKNLSETGQYPLEVQQQWLLQYQIQNNTVQVLEASCPDQDCTKQHGISHVGDVIVCLPNRVVLEIVSTSYTPTDTLDTISY